MINHKDVYKDGVYRFEVDGKIYDSKWIEENLGIAPLTVYTRISQGLMTVEEALELRKQRTARERIPFTISVNGVSKTLKEWSQLSGISVSTIRSRLGRGIRGEKLFISNSGDMTGLRRLIHNKVIPVPVSIPEDRTVEIFYEDAKVTHVDVMFALMAFITFFFISMGIIVYMFYK